jgi:uncharacterized protein (TIGR02588 family)
MKTEKNWVEWAVFGVSLAVVGAVIVLLMIDARRASGEGPRFRVEAGSAAADGAHFEVPIRVHNEGDETAEEVRIDVILRRGEEEVERSHVTFAFLPRRSHREGTVVFKTDPRRLTLDFKPVGFVRP